jgi:hypothetical protein
MREEIKKILVDTCGQTCSNGSESDYRAVDKLITLIDKEIIGKNEEFMGKPKESHHTGVWHETKNNLRNQLRDEQREKLHA